MDMLPEDVAEEEPVLLCAAEEVEGELRTVGILSATMDGNSWYITHIAVEKDMRRQGISIDYVCTLLDDTLEYSGALTGIFWLSYQQILEKYGDNVRLFANTQNDMSERLFLKFAAGKKEVYGVSVEREMAL